MKRDNVRIILEINRVLRVTKRINERKSLVVMVVVMTMVMVVMMMVMVVVDR